MAHRLERLDEALSHRLGAGGRRRVERGDGEEDVLVARVVADAVAVVDGRRVAHERVGGGRDLAGGDAEVGAAHERLVLVQLGHRQAVLEGGQLQAEQVPVDALAAHRHHGVVLVRVHRRAQQLHLLLVADGARRAAHRLRELHRLRRARPDGLGAAAGEHPLLRRLVVRARLVVQPANEQTAVTLGSVGGGKGLTCKTRTAWPSAGSCPGSSAAS